MAVQLGLFIPFHEGVIGQDMWLQNTSGRTIFIDWGDGSGEEVSNAVYISHTYDTAGTYSVYAYYEDVWGTDTNDAIETTNNRLILIEAGDSDITTAFVIRDHISYTQNTLNNAFLSLSLPNSSVSIGSNEFGIVDNINSVLTKLNDNYQYLEEQTTIIDPTIANTFVGWLSGGTGTNNLWNADVPGYNTFFNPPTASSNFTNIVDVKAKVINDIHYLILAENNRIKFLNNISVNAPITTQISGVGLNQTFSALSAFDINTAGDLYILDGNLVYKMQFDYVANNISLQTQIGGIGNIDDKYLFNHPTDIALDDNAQVYVVDTNNLCIKVYNRNLIWVKNITSDLFTNSNKPLKVCINHVTAEIYVVTSNRELFVFDAAFNLAYHSSLLTSSNTSLMVASLQSQNIQKIFTDSYNNYGYIITDSAAIKFTKYGRLISQVLYPTSSVMTNLRSGTIDDHNQIYIAKNDRLYQILDPITAVSLKRDIPSPISINDILLHSSGNEFVQNWVYNKAIKRLLRNLVILNGSIQQKIVVSFDLDGSLRSFYVRPIDLTEKANISIGLDNYIGVNEIVLSDVVNRALNQILNLQKAVLETIRPNVVFIPSTNTYPVLP